MHLAWELFDSWRYRAENFAQSPERHMGTWSTAIHGNDEFGDVATEFDRHLKSSQSVERTTEHVLASMSDYFDDEDDRESAYFALADRQWTYGKLDDSILSIVNAKDFGMLAWGDADDAQCSERRSAINSFLQKISRPNPQPKTLPRLIRRQPKFGPGDCLSYRNPDGRYTAGLVTAVNDSDPEHGRDLVVLMDYLSTGPPDISDFIARKWLHTPKGDLMCYWYGPAGYKAVSKMLSMIGTITLLDNDPRDSNAHADWQGFGPFVIRAKGTSR